MPKIAFPLLSALLLLLSYGSFAWFLSHQGVGAIMWAVAIAFALAQVLLLTVLADSSKLAVDAWLRSDLGYFSCVILGALLVAFAFIWVRVFGYILVAIATTMLMRLDLQLVGFTRLQAWLLLTLLSLSGLAMGRVVSYYIVT